MIRCFEVLGNLEVNTTSLEPTTTRRAFRVFDKRNSMGDDIFCIYIPFSVTFLKIH